MSRKLEEDADDFKLSGKKWGISLDKLSIL